MALEQTPAAHPRRRRSRAWAAVTLAGALAAACGCGGTSANRSANTGGPSSRGAGGHATVSSSLTGGTPGERPRRLRRPNIVFVLTDDLAWNLVPYMPHVLAMERRGATFTNYFVSDSLCCQ